MHYCGLVFGDGVTAESRIEDELTHKPPNKDFAAAVQEHGRYAFEWEVTGNHDSLRDALIFEAEQIEHFKSWHPDHGWNKTRGIDKKRMKRAEAEYVPGASTDDLLNAAIVDFRYHSEEWRPYDTPANEATLRAYMLKEKCTPYLALTACLEAGTLVVA